MGYDYVFYQDGMEKDPLSNNLYFIIESPQYDIYSRSIDLAEKYDVTDINFYNNYCTLKNSESFPSNIANGWFFSSITFSPELDFQQDKVIVWAVNKILAKVENIESANLKFHFGGYAWDVPGLEGDFWTEFGGTPTNLAYWTGGDFGIIYGNNVHNYATHSDGTAEFYKALFKATRAKYSRMKVIYEPYYIWGNWINVIKNRVDAKEIMPDVLSQEDSSIDFLDDDSIYKTNLIDKEHTMSTTPNNFSEQANRVNAAKLAVNKSWFNFFGRFGGTGDMPNYMNIQNVPTRLKLIRVLPNWENMNNTPVTDRKWDGTVYESGNAYASDSAICVLQPKTSKLFVVFLKAEGVITLPAGKKVKNVYKTDSLLCETSDGMSDLIFMDNVMCLIWKRNLDIGLQQ